MFDVLPGLPAYGDLPRVIGQWGDPVYREGYVVRFLAGTPREWVGNFHRGPGVLDTVVLHPDRCHVLVIAGGTAYVVDPAGQSVEDIGRGLWESCVATPDGSGLVLSDLVFVGFISGTGPAWISRRLAWDGVRILQVTHDTVRGEAGHFDGTWHPFTVDLATGAADGGAYDGPEF